jgi:ribosomal protein S18 acetylase RimI-like enzyme
MDAILDLERAAAAHWRGTEEEWLGDWLLRAADGFTGRANSVLPLGDPGLPLDGALARLTRWYRDRGLPPMIVLPVPLEGDSPARALDDELAGRGWATRKAPAFVMIADLPAASAQPSVPGAGLPAGLAVLADQAPDDAWLGAYHYRGLEDPPPVMRTVLTSAADQVFISIRTTAGPDAPVGTVVAIARLSLAVGWAGITAVEVRPEHRRAGLGGALTREVFAAAASRDLSKVFLQVEVDNLAARRLYERAGFRYSHRYHYRVAPA